MLGRRILTAAVLIPLALAGLFLASQQTWGIASALVIAIGAWEWGRLSGLGQVGRVVFAAVTLAFCAATLLFMEPLVADEILLSLTVTGICFWLMIVVAVLLSLLQRSFHVVSTAKLSRSLLVVFGGMTLLPPWGAAMLLQPAPARMLALMATIWVADSAAYFAGRRFGRHKLAPTISPGKSWEGVLGAFMGVALYFFLLERVWPDLLSSRPPLATLAFLEVIVAISIVGDLFESWMKRNAGLKDSGSILPGHGGILDRIDSLTAALPFIAMFVKWSSAGTL